MAETQFDYVIVGGGTAGCVLAARLTEDPDIRVLVLEAGPDRRGPMNRAPAGVVGLYRAGRLHWDYMSEPEAHAGGRALPYKMGKTLGGSSSINALLWVRGAPAVYDGWAERGCAGWSYEDVEPIFRRIERFSDPSDPHMGRGGPIGIAKGNPGASPLNAAFMKAMAEAGHPATDNYNGPDQDGACILHRNTDRGERSDVYREYLTPARKRPNIEIRCRVHVERLAIEGRRVVGVEYALGGRVVRVLPRRETLLCAGSIASPQLLLLSGIGDPDALEPHGIPPCHELRGVGRNMHTHPAIRVSYACTQPVSLLAWTRPPKKWLAGLEWLIRRTGMAATNHMDAGFFVRTRPGLAFADAMITFTPLALAGNYDDSGVEGFETYMELVGVKSRGRLTLRSADPRARPVFRFNFLEDRRDLVAFRKGARLMREIVAQPAFDPYRGEELSPGAHVATDGALDRWIRETCNISHHIAGTCRMGAADDPDAVVGPDLRLRGLDGLRVADNSVMPFVSNGNTHAPAVMIGEKASDLIRGERGA